MARKPGVDKGRALGRLTHQCMERLSDWITDWVSGTWAFLLAAGAVVVWLGLGPLLHYSEGWYLLITVPTTIFTFLMVFLIQRSQRKESMVLQIKLNELIVSQKGARNHLVDLDDLNEEQLQRFLDAYAHLAHAASGTQDAVISRQEKAAAAAEAAQAAPE